MNEERVFWLAWSRLWGVGPVLLRKLQQRFGTLSAAWTASASELRQVEGLGDRKVETLISQRSRLDPQQLYDRHQQQNPHFWTLADPDYPRLLKEIPNPPAVLYYRGTVEASELEGTTPTVAIIGTRHPSDYGRRWTHRLSETLAARGFVIISGMAAGIDTHAHQACLQAGRRTIAVFGTGVDVVYPSSNRRLYEKILDNGLVVSEYPAGTKPDRAHFPQRNRIIAGLSRAAIVMEAPKKSGALITAYLANDFCRDVYALPGSLDNDRAIGCLGLLDSGAQVILGEEELLEMLCAMPSVDLDETEQLTLFSDSTDKNATVAPPPDLEPQLARVLEAIPSAPTSFDAIVQQAELDAASVSGALLQLELLELISQLPGMRYRRIA